MAKKLRPNFLIVGMQRSGSVWLGAILNSHPDIACFPNIPFDPQPGGNKIGDVDFFNILAGLEPGEHKFTLPLNRYLAMYNKFFADLVPLEKTLPREEFYKVMQKRYSECCDKIRGDKKLVGENTTDYIFHLNFIDKLYPGIKKICIIRDPKDKIVSWHFSLVNKGRRKEKEVTKDFALGYLNERIIPEYEALLTYDGSIHCITYEKLVLEPEKTIADILDYFEVQKSPEIISHMIKNASFEKQTVRAEGVARKAGEENRTSQIRKGVAGDWKNHMPQGLAQKIDAAVADLRKEAFKKYQVYH